MYTGKNRVDRGQRDHRFGAAGWRAAGRVVVCAGAGDLIGGEHATAFILRDRLCFFLHNAQGLIYPLWFQLWRGMTRVSEGDFIAPYSIHPQMIGIIERFFYTTAWLADTPEFIAIWLALKIGGQWGAWSDPQTLTQSESKESESATITVHGRTIYNVFLIGTGVSLIYGVAGGLVIDWLEEEHYLRAFGIIFFLAVTSVIFYIWAKYDADQQKAKP